MTEPIRCSRYCACRSSHTDIWIMAAISVLLLAFGIIGLVVAYG